MSLLTESTPLHGMLLIKPQKIGDERGYFLETFRHSTYSDLGLDTPFVQDNCSVCARGVLRGLHLQRPKSQAKLISVLSGSIFDVAVDLRRGSPTFGKWHGVHLSAENCHQVYIPTGFAHGFCALEERSIVAYKCSEYYSPQHELTILWNDPDLGINWPVASPITSAKDKSGRRLRDIANNFLPIFNQC